jgi:SAM-dependent methyltransferase
MTDRVGQSRFFRPLLRHYASTTSILLCRVPELEYASQLTLGAAALDHCCGDAIFAALGWPEEKFAGGCDLSAPSIEQARLLARHRRLDVCDAAQRLPYDDASFELVFNNSALEHIPDLDRTLAEVARVVRPGGRFAFNVLNHRYFAWWPAEAPPAAEYREWQPFLHALDRDEWIARLGAAGFRVRELHGYFGEEAARVLAQLDSEFSGHFAGRIQSALVAEYQSSWLARRRWRKRIAALSWRTEPDGGAGYFFVCERQ